MPTGLKQDPMDTSSQIQLLPLEARAPSDKHSTSYGKASSKPTIDRDDIFALLISLVCFVLAVLTILPDLSLSWRLGLKNQIVIVGVILAIQRFCLDRLMQNAFILLEARLGKSVLQNYDAILRKQFVGSNVHIGWRVALCMLSFLPIFLGIAYKQFLGGTSTASMSNDVFPNAMYGLAYPDLGSYASLNNAMYLSMNANADFLNASTWDDEYPSNTDFPLAYGYNTLVLGENSAALLDLPLRTNISEIQGKLVSNETWQLSADVDAFISTRNDSIASLRQDPDFVYLTTQYAYNGLAFELLFREVTPPLSFGWIGANGPELGDAYCLMGSFGTDSITAPSSIGSTNDSSSDFFLSFIDSAQMFNIQRRSCHGEWIISQSEIKLLSGFCSQQPTVNSTFLLNPLTNPYPFDVLPILVNTIGTFNTTRASAPGYASPWMQVSYAVTAANIWWARSVNLEYGSTIAGYMSRNYPYTVYAARNQSITSTRPTLDATWGLYLTVAISPILTLILFIPLPVLYSLPIGTNFGLTSILAGIESDSLALVQGAGLSGKLDRKIHLEISSEEAVVSEHLGPGGGRGGVTSLNRRRIRYTLSERARQPVTAGIEHGQEYE